MATTNPWKEFQGLLPKPRRLIGTVVSHGGDGISMITLRDGSLLAVRGQGVDVGKKALVENQTIVREVSDLPVYQVQV